MGHKNGKFHRFSLENDWFTDIFHVYATKLLSRAKPAGSNSIGLINLNQNAKIQELSGGPEEILSVTKFVENRYCPVRFRSIIYSFVLFES